MNVFDALADATRREIVGLLAARGQMNASQIYQQFPATPSAISQHLKVLREARLVTVSKQAQRRLYQLDLAGMVAVEQWARQTRQQWSQRFDALEVLLEREQRKLKGGRDD